MKEIQETIIETLKMIPEEYFFKKNKSDESIYINLDKIGYKLDTEGKGFKTKSNVEIRMFEIKSIDVKTTKSETISLLLAKFKRQEEVIKKVGLSRKR